MGFYILRLLLVFFKCDFEEAYIFLFDNQIQWFEWLQVCP